MSLEEFISKWNGKTADFDGSYGGQCVDLWRFYIKEVLGLPQSPPVVGAKDIWDTYLKDEFLRVENGPTNFPEAGDIVIWGDTYGKFGHVAICTSGNEKTFTCFSQNDPTGSKCGLKTYNYKHVRGWLKRQAHGIISSPEPDIRLKILTEFRHENFPNGIVSEGDLREILGGFVDGLKTQVDLENCKKELKEKEKQLSEITKVNEDLQTIINLSNNMARPKIEVSDIGQMTMDDWQRVANNALVFFVPLLIVVIPVLISSIPEDAAWGAIALYLLNVALDALKKRQARSEYKVN